MLTKKMEETIEKLGLREVHSWYDNGGSIDDFGQASEDNGDTNLKLLDYYGEEGYDDLGIAFDGTIHQEDYVEIIKDEGVDEDSDDLSGGETCLCRKTLKVKEGFDINIPLISFSFDGGDYGAYEFDDCIVDDNCIVVKHGDCEYDYHVYLKEMTDKEIDIVYLVSRCLES